MADIASTRVQLIDNSTTRSDGKRVHRILGWQQVTLPDFGMMYQPVDTQVDGVTFSTTKQITGILFCDGEVFQNQANFGCNAPIRTTRPYD